MSSTIDMVYNVWLFKKWSDVGTLTMQEIDDSFGEEMKASEPGPLMHEFKAFIENKEWEQDQPKPEEN